jgi:CheY-like chemotaxis protein
VPALLSPDEAPRLRVPGGCEILGIDPELEFDDTTLLATQICGTPMALMTLLDHKRRLIKSTVGLPTSESSREIAFCAVAMDVDMPHLSGKELSEKIQTLYPNTKILFTSAFTENAFVHQGALNKGANLLQKPFTPTVLARKIREVLDQ